MLPIQKLTSTIPTMHFNASEMIFLMGCPHAAKKARILKHLSANIRPLRLLRMANVASVRLRALRGAVVSNPHEPAGRPANESGALRPRHGAPFGGKPQYPAPSLPAQPAQSWSMPQLTRRRHPERPTAGSLYCEVTAGAIAIGSAFRMIKTLRNGR
jgi:hypothetical protein